MQDRLLTQAEYELMEALWGLRQGDVRQVMARLEQERAYTTVSTILRILEKKGFVRSEKQGRSHIYQPTLGKLAYQKRKLGHVFGQLFGRTGASVLVRDLVDQDQLDAEELRALRALIDEKLKP